MHREFHQLIIAPCTAGVEFILLHILTALGFDFFDQRLIPWAFLISRFGNAVK